MIFLKELENWFKNCRLCRSIRRRCRSRCLGRPRRPRGSRPPHARRPVAPPNSDTVLGLPPGGRIRLPLLNKHADLLTQSRQIVITPDIGQTVVAPAIIHCSMGGPPLDMRHYAALLRAGFN